MAVVVTSPDLTAVIGTTVQGVPSAGALPFVQANGVTVSWGTEALPYAFGLSTDGVNITVRDLTGLVVGTGVDLGALLNARQNTGVTFFLGPGSFPAATRSSFTHPGITVFAFNALSTTIVSTGTTDSVLKWNTGATYGRCSGVTVTTAATNANGIIFVAADGLCENTIVTCNAATGSGIVGAVGSTRLRVANCQVSGAKNFGININDDDCVIERNLATGCGDGTGNAQAGINVAAGQRAKLLNNTCSTNGVNGIRWASIGVDGGHIAFNTCTGNGALGVAGGFVGRGIGVTSASGNNNVRIIGNRCTGNYENGIAVNAGAALSATIVGNYSAANNVGVFAGGHGIELDTPGTISGNICTGNNNGISVTGNNVLVTGNVCFSNAGTQGNGIALNGTGATITGNNCYSNGNDGIKLFTNAAGVCTGNICSLNTGYGIEHTSAGLVYFTANDLFTNTAGNSTYGTLAVLNGPFLQIASPVAVYTAKGADQVVLADATAGAFTVTLPTAAARAGQEYVVKRLNAGGNAVTMGTTGGQTIDGAATQVLASQYDALHVVSDGTNWQIIGERPAALGL